MQVFCVVKNFPSDNNSGSSQVTVACRCLAMGDFVGGKVSAATEFRSLAGSTELYMSTTKV